MLDKLLATIVDNSLDGFFSQTLKDHYDKRRQTLNEVNKVSIPAIDYILRIGQLGKSINYPPESASDWIEYFVKLQSHGNAVLSQILFIYLKLDIASFLASSREYLNEDEIIALEVAERKLLTIPEAFDFSNVVVHLATGLWAVDNESTSMIISTLSNPSIHLGNYFEYPKEVADIIVDGLIISHNPRIALFMSKIHRFEGWDQSYDHKYASLLVSSGQLIEALKYERIFADQESYNDILQRFFELCSEWNVTKSLNRLNLNIEEEEMLNQHLKSSESRPITPSGRQTPSSQQSQQSKPKPQRSRTQTAQRARAFTDSPALNTRSARKRKTVK